jgi:hypothetical protein
MAAVKVLAESRDIAMVVLTRPEEVAAIINGTPVVGPKN